MTDELLEWISAHCYDYGHGLLPGSGFVVDVLPLLANIARLQGLTDDEMRERYDRARFNAQWNELAADGKCAGYGGPEWDHCIEKWLQTDREGKPSDFILNEVGQ